jgi:hypothetical protein
VEVHGTPSALARLTYARCAALPPLYKAAVPAHSSIEGSDLSWAQSTTCAPHEKLRKESAIRSYAHYGTQRSLSVYRAQRRRISVTVAERSGGATKNSAQIRALSRLFARHEFDVQRVLQQLGTFRLRGWLLRRVMAETVNGAALAHTIDFSPQETDRTLALICQCCGDTMEYIRKVARPGVRPPLLVFVCRSCKDVAARQFKCFA